MLIQSLFMTFASGNKTKYPYFISGLLSKRFYQISKILTSESGSPVHPPTGLKVLSLEELETMFIDDASCREELYWHLKNNPATVF